MQWFLAILFALPLCYNTRERAAATAGKNWSVSTDITDQMLVLKIAI